MVTRNQLEIDPAAGVVRKRGPRIEQEAAALRDCEHPGVVPIVAFDGVELVLPALPGDTLASCIRHKPLEPEAAEIFASDLTRTLQHIHSRGWIHNDICPANIILTAGGPMVIDFDAASRISEPLPHLLGTVHYMAPERFDNQPPSPASDFYSFGITLYEVVAHRLPFEAGTRAEIVAAHHLGKLIGLDQIKPDLPNGLVKLITKLTSRNPGQRLSL